MIVRIFQSVSGNKKGTDLTPLDYIVVKVIIPRGIYPTSSLYKSIAGRYRPVSYPDGPITARCRFIKNASWVNIQLR